MAKHNKGSRGRIESAVKWIKGDATVNEGVHEVCCLIRQDRDGQLEALNKLLLKQLPGEDEFARRFIGKTPLECASIIRDFIKSKLKKG